jgi:hypothetical protein
LHAATLLNCFEVVPDDARAVVSEQFGSVENPNRTWVEIPERSAWPKASRDSSHRIF